MNNFNLTPVNVLTSQQYQSNWLIKDFMESNSIGMLFGAPASAKSFIAMDIAFCVGAGIDWDTNKTKQGNVVYIAGEGFSGMSKRFKALECKYNTSTRNVYISDMPADLSSKKSANSVYEEITRTCPNPALIIVDTLHRNFGGGDENSSKDIGEFILILTTIAKATGAAILIVHHSGHDASNRARGSSSIKAAMDFEYKASKKDSLVTVNCTKAKEFEGASPASFNLKSVQLPGWLDDDGNPVESAILEPTTYTSPTRTPSLKEIDLKSMSILKEAIDKNGTNANANHASNNPELKTKKYFLLKNWFGIASGLFDTGNIKPASIKQNFQRSKNRLINERKIMVIDNYCYVLN